MISAFEKFQNEAVDKIRERLDPSWKPADPKKELPFNLSKSDWRWFERNVPWDVPNIMKMSTAELKSYFPKKKSRTTIIRTFIWQCWILIQMGEMEPIKSTLRSLWYRELESFMRRHKMIKDPVHGDTDSDEDRIVETMREQLGLLVDHRIFRYSGAFQFVPLFNTAYSIGRNDRKAFFFTEKVGLWGTTCHQLYKHPTNSISVMASNGEPSALTLEEMAMELWRRGTRSLLQFTFSDYDPYGWWIDATLDRMMRRFGFEVTTWRLTTPDLFTEEDALGCKDYSAIIAKFAMQELHSDYVFKPTAKERLIYNWFKLSGGWNGKPLAMHCDKISEKKREARVQQFLKEILKDKPDLAKLPGILVESDEPKRLIKPVGRPTSHEPVPRMFRI
ncbi:MAG: hypothetical protein JSS66_19125 [Armatimonadetes bacterium]|nr:hypothetical protein [Armatimonadota bacterium]